MKQPERAPVKRIVLLSMDSLNSGIALPLMVEHWQDRVVGICLSRPFGGTSGSMWRQFTKNLRRSGPGFVVYFALQLILFYPMSVLATGINRILGRRQFVYQLRQLARQLGIPVFSTSEPNSEATVERIRALKPDLIVVCYFDRVIRQPLIDIPPRGIINIHTALLPEMKGPVPNIWAVLEGHSEIGATVHYIDSETLDTGAILKRGTIEREPGESVLALDCNLIAYGAELAIQVVDEIGSGDARALAQDADAGRYLSFPTRADLKLLRRQGDRLYRLRDFVRPFFRYPG